MTSPTKEQYLFTLGGRVRCLRCNATSKRTKQQCKAPAIKGRSNCRFHGGKSTGPITDHGKARCAEIRTKHGLESKQARIARSKAMEALRKLSSGLAFTDSPLMRD